MTGSLSTPDARVRDVERVRCAFVYPSRRRCSNTATTGDHCEQHAVLRAANTGEDQ